MPFTFLPVSILQLILVLFISVYALEGEGFILKHTVHCMVSNVEFRCERAFSES